MGKKELKSNTSAVILGGGTAGWLTALYISKTWPGLNVTVIEDPSKPPIIAGESGGYYLVMLYELLGINFREWAIATGATPKVGGKFIGWNGKDHVFWHSLISPYAYLWGMRFPNDKTRYFYLRALLGLNIPVADILASGEILKNNKVPFDNNLILNQEIKSMWHFDSRANADYLKQIGLAQGIDLVEGTYQNCVKINDNIECLKFEDGRTLHADWFFDCSGFARLLLDKEYNIEKIDYTENFPARSVIAWWDKPDYSSATIATTMNAGWSWKIGLRERTGQGYLYDPNILSKDQALEEIHTKFGQHVEPVASLTFVPALLKENAKNNVIGIGLSTGFMEPLEANGTAVIANALTVLGEIWNPFIKRQEFIEEFNKKMWNFNEAIKDFLLLHYRGHGLETEFWKDQRTNKIRVPDSLKDKLDKWEEFYRTGKINPNEYTGHYNFESWATVIQALNLVDYKLIKTGDVNNLVYDYYLKEKMMHKTAQESAIGIEEWIKRF